MGQVSVCRALLGAAGSGIPMVCEHEPWGACRLSLLPACSFMGAPWQKKHKNVALGYHFPINQMLKRNSRFEDPLSHVFASLSNLSP